MTVTAEQPTYTTTMLVNGRWIPGGDGTFEVVNPATGQVLAQVAAGSASDIDTAVEAARAALSGEWGAMPGTERARLLNRIADLIERDASLFAQLEALEVGKTIHGVQNFEVPNAAATFRHFAGYADKLHGQTIPTAGYLGRPTHSYTVREPIGVIGAIVPWNAPLMITSWKLAPGLAAGNTVVVKPAEDAPLSVLHLAELLQEAGLPPGVVNVVPGLGETAGAALASHADVDKISFTGSPEVGRLIQTQAASTFKRLTLELGGKTPHIVLPDADLDAAIPVIALGLFTNAGEVCAAGTRILVHRSIHDEVVRRLEDTDEAVTLANDTAYGLAACVWTRDLSHAHRIAARVRAATVWVNGWGVMDPALPWGGMKTSGIGRELGWAGILADTEEKVVTIVL
jgi:betaine-aldehyde dehydrogenase